MKKLKKLERPDLKSIVGSKGDDCQVDLDCGPAGCAVCVTLRPGNKTCMFLFEPSLCPF
ncbi:bacteriocin-like protein [Chryseobacterium sp. JUb7]|uniref:bacteriocin-like protein n=1 Tax=Chryseobacterium sp. JUb7 TaxID=2940599 RepID=UPI0021699BC6|nr:hypothetical protein [Chryseobacterium sp. JUb7]MCS3531582.1 hypothetical protein [Chryseobacterium sp. JUb7]